MTEEATNPVADDGARVTEGEGVELDTAQIDGTETEATEESTEGDDALEAEQPAAEDDDTEEIEWEDGQKYRVPKALKPGFLRQADYTRKTQELADQKRQHSESVAQWAAADDEVVEARATLKTLDNRLSQIEGLTEAQWAQLDPQRQQSLLREQITLRDQRAQIEGAVADHTARKIEAREREHANLRQAMFEAVQQKVPDWSDKLGDEIADFAMSELGVTPDDLRNMTYAPALLALHRAFLGNKALKAQRETQKIAQRQKTAPAQTVRGQGGRFAATPDTSDFAAFERLADETLASS